MGDELHSPRSQRVIRSAVDALLDEAREAGDRDRTARLEELRERLDGHGDAPEAPAEDPAPGDW